MNISLNWIKDHVPGLDRVDPKELGLKLTMSTVEVEEMKNLAEDLDKVVVGKITKLTEHPNADKLKIAIVDDGENKLKIVCGGSNLKENMFVALAKVGSRVRWHGQGDLIEMKPAKVRGEESHGMICAATELGLDHLFTDPGEKEIIDLSDFDCHPGQSLAEVLGIDDIVYEIDNKSLTNRPDLWGHYGLAREVAAIYDLKLRPYDLNKIKTNKKKDLTVKVRDFNKCPRYMAVVLENVEIEESPLWLKKKLRAIGQKPINNIVDITNYIMYDLGQPLHAFSADKISDSEIIVRPAKNGEEITTLDGEKRKLTGQDLLIADKQEAVGLGRDMSGAKSEFNENTKQISIESAKLEPSGIRRTAGRLDLRSEAAIRYEKSLNPNLAEKALTKAVNLIQDLNPKAEVISPVENQAKFDLDQGTIKIDWSYIEQRIGEKIDSKKVLHILTSLGFEVKEKKQELLVKVPTWRATKDVSIKQDIIEEITRIYGYDNLEPKMPAVSLQYFPENKLRGLERKIKSILTLNGGADEVYNYSFVSKKFLQKINCPLNHVELQNPWSEDLALMRKSLIPNLLLAVQKNINIYNEINIFEIGKVFDKRKRGEMIEPDSKNYLPEQNLKAGGIVYLDKEETFFQAKGLIQALAENLDMNFDFQSSENSSCVWIYPNQSLDIFVGREKVGYVCNLHPLVAEKMDFKAAVWEIDWSKLAIADQPVKKFKEFSRFPAVELDVSMFVKKSVQWAQIRDLIKGVNPELIKTVELLDVFKNDKIKEDTKSVTCRVIYQSEERTLAMKELEKEHDNVVKNLEEVLKAKIRK